MVTMRQMPESLAWKAEHVRITFLFASRLPSEGLFESLTQTVPDSVVQDHKQGQLQEIGVFDDLQLSCITSLNRLDIILAVQHLHHLNLQLLDLEVGFSTLRKFAQKVFDAGEKPSRLALGAVLNSNVSSRSDGYLLLDQLLPDFKVDPIIEDFLLQLNRPRASHAIAGNKVNRLCKWSVAAMHRWQMGSGVQRGITFTDPAYACRLELDINSIPAVPLLSVGAPPPLPHELLPALWDELVQTAREISQKGDVL